MDLLGRIREYEAAYDAHFQMALRGGMSTDSTRSKLRAARERLREAMDDHEARGAVEPLAKIIDAIEAWENDEPYGDEGQFVSDASFLEHIGRVARADTVRGAVSDGDQLRDLLRRAHDALPNDSKYDNLAREIRAAKVFDMPPARGAVDRTAESLWWDGPKGDALLDRLRDVGVPEPALLAVAAEVEKVLMPRNVRGAVDPNARLREALARVARWARERVDPDKVAWEAERALRVDTPLNRGAVCIQAADGMSCQQLDCRDCSPALDEDHAVLASEHDDRLLDYEELALPRKDHNA
jgi:hypothetical protein